MVVLEEKDREKSDRNDLVLDSRESFLMQGTTKENNIIQSAKLIQEGNGQGDAAEIYMNA